jgi:hypothetical protein
MTSDEFTEQLDENLRKWFKEKWVRFGPDGKIRGACARGDDSEGKPKCLPQKKAQNLGKKGRKYAASKKRREDPNPERTGKAKNVATKKKTNEDIPFNQCPKCRGPIVHESMMNEKQDACYHKVKSRYKVWPSAYASGALVQCRKKGASNWGNSKKTESSIMKGIIGETEAPKLVQISKPVTQDPIDDPWMGINVITKYKVGDKVYSVLSVKELEQEDVYGTYIFDNTDPKNHMDDVAEIDIYGNRAIFDKNHTGAPKDVWYQLPENIAMALHNASFPEAKKLLDAQPMPDEDELYEEESVLVLYIDGKPSAKYAIGHEAKTAMERLQAKFPNKKLELKREMRAAQVGEAKAKPYVKPFIENGKQVGWKSSDGYHVKYWQMFAKDSAIKHAKLNPDEVDEGIDWQRGENNNQHDHTISDAEEYLTHIYPVVKKYMVRRAEVGFRANDKQFLKSMSHMKDVDGVINYLGLTELPTMSGSKQVSPSIGYTWTTFLSPNKKAAITYYQDRGMGQDMIYIAAIDKILHRKIYDVFVDAGVIVGRDKKLPEPKLPDAMRVSNTTNRDEAFKKAMDKFYGKTDDKDVKEDYTGEFAAEKTPAINPYGGLKDRQHRGAISETPTDNTTGASGEGGWRKYKPKPAGELDESRMHQYDINDAINKVHAYHRTQGSPYRGAATRLLNAHYQWKNTEDENMVTRAQLLRTPNMGKQAMALLDNLLGNVSTGESPYDQNRNQAIVILDSLKQALASDDLQSILALMRELKNAIGNMDRLSYKRVREDTAYAGGMGQGGNAGQSYRKFKPKSAGTFKEEQLDEKCWDTHKQVGMKNKGGKQVPNCVPKESAIMKGLKRL